MLKISSGLQIEEKDAPRLFADILENDDFGIVKLVVETVLKEGSGSMKVTLLNALSTELSRQIIVQQQLPTEFQKATIERDIQELRNLHGRAVKATSEIFDGATDVVSDPPGV